MNNTPEEQVVLLESLVKWDTNWVSKNKSKLFLYNICDTNKLGNHSVRSINFTNLNEDQLTRVIKCIKNFTGTEALSFSSCNFEVNHFSELFSIKSNAKIGILLLENSPMNNKTIEELGKNIGKLKNLKKLRLSNIGLTKENSKYLLDGFKQLKSKEFSRMDFSHNNLEYEGFNFIVEAIKQLNVEKLHHLDFRYSNLGKNSIELISKLLKKTKNLQQIILDGNKLGGCQNDSNLFDNFVRDLQSLKSISLHDNGIDGDNFRQMIPLFFSKFETEIILSNNCIGDGILPLCDRLKQGNACLGVYNLESNHIPPYAISILANALKKSSKKYRCEIKLGNNSIGNRMGALLVDNLSQHRMSCAPDKDKPTYLLQVNLLNQKNTQKINENTVTNQ